MVKKDVALVCPVAGLSSRFGGKIKQFAKVGPNDESLIEYSLNQALLSDFSKIIFIVGEHTEKFFKEKFGNEYKGVPVYYAFQEFNLNLRDKPWGVADALCSARDFIDCPFVFFSGDDIYGENTFKMLFNHLQESDECASVGYCLKDVIPEDGRVNRGIFESSEGYVKKLNEFFNIGFSNLKEKNLSRNSLCSMSIFAFHPFILENLYNRLLSFKINNVSNSQIEFLLTDEISKLINEGKLKMRLYSTKDKWLGVTNPEDEEFVKDLLKK